MTSTTTPKLTTPQRKAQARALVTDAGIPVTYVGGNPRWLRVDVDLVNVTPAAELLAQLGRVEILADEPRSIYVHAA